MRRILAIGDIHGCSVALQTLVASVPIHDDDLAVTDNGLPALSAARSFTVVVRLPPTATIGRNGSGSVNLAFGTFAGKTYRVEYKDSLSAAVWTPLGSAILANGDSLTVPDNLGANPQRFYRIVQLD